MNGSVFTAPEGSGDVVLGKTLPALLDDACARYTNEQAFNQHQGDDWRPISIQEFRTQAEEVCLGLHENGLERGDRVALFMESDVYFCVVDMGCLLAGAVDVPIYLTHGDEAVEYVMQHAEARVLFVSDTAGLERLLPMVERVQAPETIIVAETSADLSEYAAPRDVRLLTLDALRALGRKRRADSPGALDELRAQIDPHDLATIIYTSGTTGQPKGVMLTHENISFNALAAFSGLRDFRPGQDGEVALSFLPLTHVFARTLQYGFMAYGASVYFTHPDNLSEDLRRVRPTIFASVPRVLEKVYTRIRERAALMKGLKRHLLYWALNLAERYDVNEPPTGLYRMQLAIADKLVFSKWREALGGRTRYVISGGAALSPRLAGLFGAAGVTVLQGYGLTESSPIIAYNRPDANRPETVGTLLPGIEVRIAEDGEILTRGPHVMKGYYRDPERTAEAIDSDGWLYTGDVGEMVDDRFLRLTDRKKDLFKLSTGKYVMPQPLENRLTTEPLVAQAVVVGAGYNFCTALIFPDLDVLDTFARSRGLGDNRSPDELLRDPQVVSRFEKIVNEANRGFDPWTTIKRFVLIPEDLTRHPDLLTPTLKLRRARVQETFADKIAALYERDEEHSAERNEHRRTAHAEAVLV